MPQEELRSTMTHLADRRGPYPPQSRSLILTLIGMTLLWIGCGGPGGRDQQELKDRRERVAVLEIVNKANLPRAEVSYLTNLIRQAASRLPHRRYEVITRENVRALLPPGKKLED